MRRRLLPLTGFARWLLVLTAAVVLTVGAALSPRWLRRAGEFRVRRVNVVGTRYLDPHDVLAASGIGPASSVFDDPAPWRDRLLKLPLVQAVEVERRLPSTLVLRVTEVEPVALARTPDLRPITGTGRVLPIPPGKTLDLPVVAVDTRIGADGRLASPTAVAVAGTLERLRALDPLFTAAVSEAAPAPGGAVRLLLREPLGLETLLPGRPTAATLRHLQAALADVTARGELARLRRVDARFTDQIVVAFNIQRP